MHTRTAIGIAALAAFAFAGSAQAGHFTGFYWGVEAGISGMSDEGVDNDTIDPIWPSFDPTTATFDTGWGAFAKAGWAFPMFHVELELGYRSNDLEQFTVLGTTHNGGGEVHEFSQMVNVLYVPSISDEVDLKLGVGVGGDYIAYKNDSGFHTVPIHDNDYVFAWQLLAGINFHTPGICSTCDIEVNYRYFQAQSPEFTEVDGGGFLHNDTYDNFNKHTVTIALVIH